MCAVAVAAAMLWVTDLRRRQTGCRRLADYYRAVDRYSGAYLTPESRDWCREMAAFYERAAGRPWLPLPLEPSEP
jgi:hypothetical protein